MNKKILGIVTLLVIGAGGYYWYSTSQQPPPLSEDDHQGDTSQESSTESTDQVDTSNDASAQSPDGQHISSTPSAISPLPVQANAMNSSDADIERVGKLSLPDLERIKREITDNPASTPESLLRFSKDLGQELETALEDRNHAMKFMKFLDKCNTSTVGSEVLLPVAATCLSHARELADEYGDEFEKMFKNSYAKADPQVKQVFDAIEDENLQDPEDSDDEGPANH